MGSAGRGMDRPSFRVECAVHSAYVLVGREYGECQRDEVEPHASSPSKSLYAAVWDTSGCALLNSFAA